MPSTNGMIESWYHTALPAVAVVVSALPTIDDFSNAQRQYARIVTLAATARTKPRNATEYIWSARRCATAPSPNSTSSAWRLPVTMNSDADPATIKNQGEITTGTAT